MVAFRTVSLFLGGSYALQSETTHQFLVNKSIIGQKEFVKLGAGMAAVAGITAGANAIGASTSSFSDSSQSSSDSSHTSSGDDSGSRTCHGLSFLTLQTANLKSYASFVDTIVLFLLNVF